MAKLLPVPRPMDFTEAMWYFTYPQDEDEKNIRIFWNGNPWIVETTKPKTSKAILDCFTME